MCAPLARNHTFLQKHRKPHAWIREQLSKSAHLPVPSRPGVKYPVRGNPSLRPDLVRDFLFSYAANHVCNFWGRKRAKYGGPGPVFKKLPGGRTRLLDPSGARGEPWRPRSCLKLWFGGCCVEAEYMFLLRDQRSAVQKSCVCIIFIWCRKRAR